MGKPILSIKGSVRRYGDNGAALTAALKKAGDAYVAVGVVKEAGTYANGASVTDVATYMEFGTETVPERSFMRRTFYEKAPQILRWRREALEAVMYHRESIEKALGRLGFLVAALVVNTVKSNVGPALSPRYAAYKKAHGLKAGTLRATDLLLRSIGFKVRRGGNH